MNCTYETTTSHYMDEDVSKIFINTLSSLNKSMTFQSQLLEGVTNLQLQKDGRLTGFTPSLPTRLKFNITANNALMSLSKELTIEVKLPDLLWLWMTLGVGATGTALFSVGLFFACLKWRRYVRQEEKWGKPLGTLHRSFWEKEILKNFVSFIDNETMVSRQHPVVSLVGNIKSTVPNHVYIILESIDDVGQMMIERFELVTPTQPITSKRTKDEIRVGNVQEKVDESIVESSNVILSDVSLDKVDEKTSLLQKTFDQSQTLSGSGQSDHSSISIKDYSKQLSAVKNDEKQMEEIFFRLIAQAKRTNCYYQSWQIMDKDAKKLRENILKDEKRYLVEEQPYSLYGQRSYLTFFISCFFGQPGENCFDWARKHINQLSIHKKVEEKWTDIIASRSVDYFDQTRKVKYCFTF